MNVKALDYTLIALQDATRRSIMQKLAQGEQRVTDLARPFDISLNSVSKHIRLLERARLVKRKVVGREHYLALDLAPLDQLGAWIDERRSSFRAAAKRAKPKKAR